MTSLNPDDPTLAPPFEVPSFPLPAGANWGADELTCLVMVKGVCGTLPLLPAPSGTPWFVTALTGRLTAFPDGGCAACFFGVVAAWVCEVCPSGLGVLVCCAFPVGPRRTKPNASTAARDEPFQVMSASS